MKIESSLQPRANRAHRCRGSQAAHAVLQRTRLLTKTRNHEPIRMCIACRTRRPARELIRLEVSSGQVMVSDLKYKLAGRGCYVCPEDVCLARALKKARLERALRKGCLVIPSRDTVMRGYRQKRRSDDYVDR